MARSHPRAKIEAPLVTEERKAELRALAKKKQTDELRKIQEDQLLAQYEQEAKEEAIPDEELRPLTINLPPSHDRITIDGTMYLHGGTYDFAKARYDSVLEQLQRAWNHEFEIEGKAMERYRKPRGMFLRPGDDQRTTSQLLRI